MFKKLGLVLIGLLFAVSPSSAQADSARLRVIQLSFIPQISAVVDIAIDDAVVFERIGFPFATDYIELEPGSHMLTTTIVDHNDATASTLLTLESGGSYSVIAEGDYTDQVSFTVVDENDLPLAETGSAGIIVNLSPDPIQDIYMDDKLVLEMIPAGAYDVTSLPVTEFTLAGHVGDTSYSEDFTPLSNATLLAVVNRNSQVIFHRSSSLTIAEYLQSIDEDAQFARIAEVMGATDLLDALTDDGSFTLFLPTNDVLDELADGALPADADQLYPMLSRHIIAQNLPPYILPDHETLTTLMDDPVLLNFGSTDSGYWEIEGAPILWDIRLANGVIYAIDGVVNPLP